MTPSAIETDLARLVSALRDERFAMLVTNDPEGAPRARPMAILSVEDAGRMWFASREKTGKVYELARDETAGITVQSHAHAISLTGTATALRDNQRTKELWSPALTPWFPNGPEDPELALIRFDPEHAELWETGTRQTFRLLFEGIKAVALGEPVDAPTSSHVSVSL